MYAVCLEEEEEGGVVASQRLCDARRRDSQTHTEREREQGRTGLRRRGLIHSSLLTAARFPQQLGRSSLDRYEYTTSSRVERVEMGCIAFCLRLFSPSGSAATRRVCTKLTALPGTLQA